MITQLTNKIKNFYKEVYNYSEKNLIQIQLMFLTSLITITIIQFNSLC